MYQIYSKFLIYGHSRGHKTQTSAITLYAHSVRFRKEKRSFKVRGNDDTGMMHLGHGNFLSSKVGMVDRSVFT